jgi:hypothetical protein
MAKQVQQRAGPVAALILHSHVQMLLGLKELAPAVTQLWSGGSRQCSTCHAGRIMIVMGIRQYVQRLPRP